KELAVGRFDMLRSVEYAAWNGAASPHGRWRSYEGRITGTKRRAGPSLGADTQPAVQAQDAERAELPDHDGNPLVSRRRSERDGGGRARRTDRREVRPRLVSPT